MRVFAIYVDDLGVFPREYTILEVFERRPLVIARQRNYSAYDITDLLVTIGSTNGVISAFMDREMEKMECFQAPIVPMTYMNGVGVQTPKQLIY